MKRWVSYRRFSNSQEKSARNQATEVLDECGAGGYDGPDQHPRAHVDAGFDPGDEHIGGDLHEDVADEEAGGVSVGLDGRWRGGRRTC